MDATSLAEAVRLKKVSPLELVTETIQRARTLNPSLNAIVYEQYEEALEKAKNFKLTNQPFAGVPIFLKDLGQEQKRKRLYIWLAFIQGCKKRSD